MNRHKNIRQNTDYARTVMADNDLKLLWDAIQNGTPIVRICETFHFSTTLYYRFKEEARIKFGDPTHAAGNIENLIKSKTRLRQLMKMLNSGKSRDYLMRFYDLASLADIDKAIIAGEEWKETQRGPEMASKIERVPAVYSNKNYWV